MKVRARVTGAAVLRARSSLCQKRREAVTVAVEQRCGQIPRLWLRMRMKFGSFSCVVRKEMQLPNMGKMLSGQGQVTLKREAPVQSR